MTGSSQPEWQRSSIGITPLTVKPRAGSRRVKKFDVVGAGTARAEKQASNGAQVNIIFPGIGDRGGGEGVEGGGSSGSRQAAAGRVCSVCTRASADYSCPRCLIGYCSSKCYKTHGSGCTEAFFRGHVERETRLREGEDGRGGGKEGRRASMTELLRRIRLDGKTCETNGEEESTIVGSSLGEDEFPTTPPPNTTTSASVRGIRGGQQYHQEDEQEEGEEGGEEGREREQELALQKRLEALALSIEQREQRDRRALPPGPALPDPKNASAAVVVADADASDRGSGGGGGGGGGGGTSNGGGGLVVVEKSAGGGGQKKVKKSRLKPAGGKEKRAGQPRVREPRRGGSTKLGRPTLGEPALGGPALGGPALGGPTLGDEGALDLLTEEEKARFLRELASGRLGKLIVPWEPWWEQSGGVQEVVTGRTTHSLPPAVVAPCFVVKTFAGGGGGGAPGSCSLTQPPTPEEESEEKQQKQQQQPQSQQKRRQKQPVLDLTGNGGGGGGGDGGGGGGGVSVIAAVASAVAHSGEQRGALEEEENGRENKKDKERRETKEKEGVENGRGGGEEKEGDKPQQQQQQQQEEEECTRHSFASLQNQACMAPDFSTLCAMKPSPALPSLAADLAYAYVLAVRLYNGCWCSDPVGASLAFVAASPVLKDRATPATVGQALARCVERAVEGEGAGFRGYAESLRQDVLLVCSDPRKLICAFQDAWGMFEAAGRTLAPSNPARPVHAKKGQRRAARELGKVEKRVGYFLLWARSHGAQAAPAMAEAVRRSLESD